MNVETGEIKSSISEKELNSGKFIPIDDSLMTRKQRRNKWVALNDNVTLLGRVRNIGFKNLNRSQKKSVRRKMKKKYA